jgi:hypothetical protein
VNPAALVKMEQERLRSGYVVNSAADKVQCRTATCSPLVARCSALLCLTRGVDVLSWQLYDKLAADWRRTDAKWREDSVPAFIGEMKAADFFGTVLTVSVDVR